VSKAAQAAPFPEPWSCSTKEEAQLSIGPESATLALSDRTVERHRAEIRTLLGFREATIADGEALTEWLRDHAVADSRNKGSAIEELGTTRMWQSAPAQQQVADGPPLNRGENYAIARLEASLSEAFVAKAISNRSICDAPHCQRQGRRQRVGHSWRSRGLGGVASAAEDHYSVPPPNTFHFVDSTF
jgi:hypothetical protein